MLIKILCKSMWKWPSFDVINRNNPNDPAGEQRETLADIYCPHHFACISP
jgi:hypothetical protein